MTRSTGSLAPPGFQDEVLNFALSQGMPWALKELKERENKASMIYPRDPSEIKDPTMTGDTDIDSILLECVRLLEVKGNDYTQGAGSSDRLKNFNDGAEMFGMEPRQVLGVYLWKHLSAVLRYIKEGQVESEPIESRIVDSINYLLLLAKIVKAPTNNELAATHTLL